MPLKEKLIFVIALLFIAMSFWTIRHKEKLDAEKMKRLEQRMKEVEELRYFEFELDRLKQKNNNISL